MDVSFVCDIGGRLHRTLIFLPGSGSFQITGCYADTTVGWLNNRTQFQRLEGLLLSRASSIQLIFLAGNSWVSWLSCHIVKFSPNSSGFHCLCVSDCSLWFSLTISGLLLLVKDSSNIV